MKGPDTFAVGQRVVRLTNNYLAGRSGTVVEIGADGRVRVHWDPDEWDRKIGVLNGKRTWIAPISLKDGTDNA